MPNFWKTLCNILMIGTLYTLALGPAERGMLLTELLIGYTEREGENPESDSDNNNPNRDSTVKVP